MKVRVDESGRSWFRFEYMGVDSAESLLVVLEHHALGMHGASVLKQCAAATSEARATYELISLLKAHSHGEISEEVWEDKAPPSKPLMEGMVEKKIDVRDFPEIPQLTGEEREGWLEIAHACLTRCISVGDAMDSADRVIRGFRERTRSRQR
jgi:hypothetical protein